MSDHSSDNDSCDGKSNLRSSWADNFPAVYIRDSAFSWLPAKLLSVDTESTPPTANVTVVLPDDWNATTSKESSVKFCSPLKQKKPSPSMEAAKESAVLTIDLSKYSNNELPLQNVDYDPENYGRLMGQSDMEDLPHLHEAAILYNLKDRHANGVPYTRVGDIIVAMNPFQWFPQNYTKETQVFYADRLIWNYVDTPAEEARRDDGRVQRRSSTYYSRLGFAPHVYETSALSYRGLVVDGMDQAILVSGESGAGKTETVKIVMSHLAMIPLMRDNSREDSTNRATSIVEKVIESNSLFEAFGNARTLRNNNSSRFGKFTQLQFDIEDKSLALNDGRNVPHCNLVGSKSYTYLLEKSRVVSHSAEEQSFHIFYQLLMAHEDDKVKFWEGLSNTNLDSFAYLTGGTVEADFIEGNPETGSWTQTVSDLALFGIHGEELTNLVRALCIVLQLGNITFGPDPANEERTVITSLEELDKLSSLFGVSAEEITTALTIRNVKARGEVMTAYLNCASSKDSRDALAKESYSKIFDVIVKTINKATSAALTTDDNDDAVAVDDNDRSSSAVKSKKKHHVISLLDLFGFESFEVNRFAQLCINYANEKLQQKYVIDNFSRIQYEYEAEGIDVFDLSLVDNADVLDLVEGRMGLIVALNEECLRPKGNDASFVYKIKTLFRNSDCLIREQLDTPVEFGIKHFAGPVKYDATKFVELNQDLLPNDLLQCASKCTNQLLGKEFLDTIRKEQGVNKRRTFSSKNTVASKFRSQLVKLMLTMDQSRTRYIRCIKPNCELQPKVTDHEITIRQLASAGLSTAITISREIYPNKLDYNTVLERFSCLSPMFTTWLAEFSTNETVEKLLSQTLQGWDTVGCDGTIKRSFACGKTRVYFRSGALERLESNRLNLYNANAIVIQRWSRKIMQQYKFFALKRAALLLQAMLHAKSQREYFQKLRRSAMVLESWARAKVARLELQTLRRNKAIVQIQKNWRGKLPRNTLDKWREAALVIQRWYSRKQTKNNFSSSIAICVEEARKDHKMKVLQGKLLQCVNNSKEEDEMVLMMKESAKMLDYSRSEMYKLRKANGEIRAEVREITQKNRKFNEMHQSFEAALTVSNRRVEQLGKSNSALMSEAIKNSQKSSKLKKELKAQKKHCELELSQLHSQFDTEIESHKQNTRKMEQALAHAKSTHEREMHGLRMEMEASKKAHEAQIVEMKEELSNTQTVHNEYLSKLSDVLESAYASREAETIQLTEEYEGKLKEKDLEIMSLRKDIKAMKEGAKRQKASKKLVDE